MIEKLIIDDGVQGRNIISSINRGPMVVRKVDVVTKQYRTRTSNQTVLERERGDGERLGQEL